jgi:hypothetical protein
MNRYPNIMYGGNAKALSESIWEEAMDEFEFVKAREIVEAMSEP